MLVGIEHFDLPPGRDVSCRYFLCAFHGKRYSLRFIGRHLKAHLFEIEDDRNDVFFYPFNRGKFVKHAGDLELCERGTGKGGEDDTAQRVTERVPITGIKPLDLINTHISFLTNRLWFRRQCNVIIRHTYWD